MHWQDMSKDEISAAAERGAVVIVMVGATEQHGSHLPTGTDSMCVQSIGHAAAQLAAASGTEVVLAPPVWWGYSRDHTGFRGTLTLSHRTLSTLLVELGHSVLSNGFSRLLYLNGHGSNDRLLYYVLRDVQDAFRSPSAIAAVTYWKLAVDLLTAQRESSPGGMAHACELETSLMLSSHPHLVRMDLAADERAAEYSPYRRQDLLSSGAVMAPDSFGDLTQSGVVGDPSVATAENGRRWSAAIAARTAELIQDLSRWPLIGPEGAT